MSDGPVEGADVLAAMAGKAFQKSTEKKAKKQQKAEAAAGGGVRKGFRPTSAAARKPAPASKKSGDDEDGEEENTPSTRAAAAAAKKSKKSGAAKASDTWKYVAFLVLICGGGLQIIVPALESMFGGGGAAREPSAFNYPAVSHVKLDASDPKQLQRVFFSGESWLVLCNNHTSEEDVSPVFDRAAAMLHHTKKASDSHHIFTALLPCYSVLPSGKNVFERWDLPYPKVETIDRDDARLPPRQRTNRDGSANVLKHTIVTAFYVSNGDKPQHLTPSFFGYRQKDDAITSTAHKLAKVVRDNTKPKTVVSVNNSGHLTQYCTKKRHCALFLYQSVDFKMPVETRNEINRLCSTYRSLRCASLDVVRYRSSLVKALPAVNAGADTWPRLVLTKKLRPDEIKKLAEEEAAEQPPAFDETPKTEEEKKAEEENTSRTVNPKARALNSIGVLAKAHRGVFSYDALATFIESVSGLSPAWPNADEAPIRAAPAVVAPADAKMTQMRNWPTVSPRPSSELPKKPKKPKTAEEIAAEEERRAKKKIADEEKRAARAAEAEKRRAAGESDARDKMDAESAERNPQEADGSDSDDSASSDSGDEESDSIDLDSNDNSDNEA